MFKETLLPSVEQLLLCGFLREPIYLVVQCSVVARGGAAAIALLHYVIVQTLNGRVRVAR